MQEETTQDKKPEPSNEVTHMDERHDFFRIWTDPIAWCPSQLLSIHHADGLGMTVGFVGRDNVSHTMRLTGSQAKQFATWLYAKLVPKTQNPPAETPSLLSHIVIAADACKVLARQHETMVAGLDSPFSPGPKGREYERLGQILDEVRDRLSVLDPSRVWHS